MELIKFSNFIEKKSKKLCKTQLADLGRSRVHKCNEGPWKVKAFYLGDIKSNKICEADSSIKNRLKMHCC